MLKPNKFNKPVPALTKPKLPLTPDDICKSGVAPPSAMVNVLFAPLNTIGAPIEAVNPLALVVTFPARVMVPVPVIEVPVMLIAETVVMLFAPTARTPLLTERVFETPVADVNETVLSPKPPVLAMVRLFTVAGNPLPVD